MVATTSAPFWYICSIIAIPSAAPSLGSVPLPISSSKTKVWRLVWRKISAIFCIWPENVLKAFSISCWSPISIKISLKIAMLLLPSWWTNTPKAVSRHVNASVFNTTVFPPALGPVIISPLASLPNETDNGTAFLPNKGWVTFDTCKISSSLTAIFTPSILREYLARAKIISSSTTISKL